MASDQVNLIKLCVGIDSVEHLLEHRRQRAELDQARGVEHVSIHVTRMWPKRSDELLNGGSLYWVIKGFVSARQTILRLDERIGPDGIRRCGIVMDPEVIRTQSAARRPFQGWRYLTPADSPPDLTGKHGHSENIPLEMQLALAEIGLR